MASFVSPSNFIISLFHFISLNLFNIRFLRSLLPADQPILRTMVSQRPIYDVGAKDVLEDEIEYTLAKLITEFLFLSSSFSRSFLGRLTVLLSLSQSRSE